MSKDIKKALEHCVEWNCDNCPNREELGSGEIVCRGRLLPEVLEYVADLEAKLTEYEKFMKDNEWGSVDAMQETLNKCEKKYFDIQKQLAEKDEQLEYFSKRDDEQEKQLEKQAKIHYKHLKEKDQDKISFAIDKLEKVKENAWQSATDISCLLDYTELAKIIDNQINVLRNNKDGIH